MDAPVKYQTDHLDFIYLPGFAAFIRDEHLEEFVLEQLRLSREIRVPLLKYFDSFPEKQLIDMIMLSAREFLTFLAENNVKAQIEDSLNKWRLNQLPSIARDQIVAEDITLVSYMRKQAFLKFIPGYTSSPELMISIIQEIDRYVLESETASTNIYIQLLKDRVSEEKYYKDKITNTSPGIVYVFDILERKGVYSDTRLFDLLEYSESELKEMGSSILLELIHPEDLGKLAHHINSLLAAKDGEIHSLECRVKIKSGRYKWHRSYDSIFRRTKTGQVWQSIGIVFDIQNEKSIAEQLKYREDELLEAQELAGLGSFEWDLTTGGVMATPKVLQILELTLDHRFEDYLANVHPTDRNRMKKVFEQAIQNQSMFEAEFRYRVDENEKILWSRGEVKLKEGKAVMKGTIMDITDRHYMLQRLQRSEEINKQAQAITHIGNYSWGLIDKTFTWSDELYRIYGLDPEHDTLNYEIVGTYNHPDDAQMVKEQIQQSIDSHKAFDFYYRIILPDHSLKILHARGEVLVDEYGKAYKLLGTAQDVTEEKTREKQLQDNKNFIQKIADAAPSVIASYSVKTGMYNFINQGLEKLLGYDPRQVLEEGVGFFLKIIHPDDMPSLMEKNTKAIEMANEAGSSVSNELISEFQYRLKHKNGQYRWFHSFGTVFDRDADGNVEYVLNISLDITERMEAERVLFEKNMELQQSNASLKEFAYVASHDLQEPLRKISTFGDRLRSTQAAQLDSEGKLYLDKIITSSVRMQQLINDLLSISMISGNKAFESYSLEDLLHEVLISLEHTIERRQAVIISDKLPVATIVPSQFRQLFQNLISNSIKFTHPEVQPSIRISAKVVPARELNNYNLAKADKYLQLTFSDNGIGFDKVFADKIFAIFQRLHNRSQYEGTGIGLAICKKIIENHGGVIFATAVEGTGANFTVVIPA